MKKITPTTNCSGIFFIIVLFWASCSGNAAQKEKALNDLENTLSLSTKTINEYTELEFKSLEEKLKDPGSRNAAMLWSVYANKIKSLTDDAAHKLDSCFRLLSKNNFEKTNQGIIGVYNQYQTSVLAVHPEIAQALGSQFHSLIDPASFSALSAADHAQFLKSRIYNAVSLVYNRAVNYCNLNGNPGCNLHFEQFSVLIGQNAKHLKAGDVLEVTAGVGAFTLTPGPKFSIDNETIKANDAGYAVFKKKISGSPGKYSIPVSIRYINIDGTERVAVNDVEYFIED